MMAQFIRLRKWLLYFMLVAVNGFPAFSQTAANGTQTNAPTGIEIVKKVTKPKKKFNDKDLSGYLLVYFKDQNQSAYLAISTDGYSFTDINDGHYSLSARAATLWKEQKSDLLKW